MAGLAGIKQDKVVGELHRRHANAHRVIADQHEGMAETRSPAHAPHHRAIARLHRQIADHHEAVSK